MSAFAEPIYGALTREFRTPWAENVTQEFMPLRVLLPTFLDLISPADADFFLSIIKYLITSLKFIKGLAELIAQPTDP